VADLVLKTKLLDDFDKALVSHVSGVVTTGMIKCKKVALQHPKMGILWRQTNILNAEQ